MKDQPISTLMERRTHTIGLDDSIEDVEAFFADNGLSWAPVVGANDVVLGVLSTADVLQFHAAKGDASQVSAWQLCTYKPISATADTPIAEVAAQMVQRRIHHVVITEQGVLCGVVSSLDFVKTYV